MGGTTRHAAHTPTPLVIGAPLGGYLFVHAGVHPRWPLNDAATRRLEDIVHDGGLTRRGATRVHRVAWTVADLRRVDRPGQEELDVAVRLRTGQPLLLDSIRPKADL